MLTMGDDDNSRNENAPTPLSDGHMKIKGAKPSSNHPSHLVIEVYTRSLVLHSVLIRNLTIFVLFLQHLRGTVPWFWAPKWTVIIMDWYHHGLVSSWTGIIGTAMDWCIMEWCHRHGNGLGTLSLCHRLPFRIARIFRFIEPKRAVDNLGFKAC